MGKKNHKKDGKKKLTKKEKKQMNHLKLIQGKKGQDQAPGEHHQNEQYKKAS